MFLQMVYQLLLSIADMRVNPLGCTRNAQFNTVISKYCIPGFAPDQPLNQQVVITLNISNVPAPQPAIFGFQPEQSKL